MQLVSRLKAHGEAWAEFCKSIEVDPVITQFAYYARSAEIAGLLHEVETDVEYQTELLKGLSDTWKLWISRHSSCE